MERCDERARNAADEGAEPDDVSDTSDGESV